MVRSAADPKRGLRDVVGRLDHAEGRPRVNGAVGEKNAGAARPVDPFRSIMRVSTVWGPERSCGHRAHAETSCPTHGKLASGSPSCSAPRRLAQIWRQGLRPWRAHTDIVSDSQQNSRAEAVHSAARRVWRQPKSANPFTPVCAVVGVGPLHGLDHLLGCEAERLAALVQVVVQREVALRERALAAHLNTANGRDVWSSIGL